MNGYTGAADGFHVNVHLITQMELPNNRDTVLHFFEQMRKGFPELRHFFKRENGDLVLESEKERESHRWLAIQARRLCSGHFNPETMDDAFRQHELVLDLAPHLLTISTLDCEASKSCTSSIFIMTEITTKSLPRRLASGMVWKGYSSFRSRRWSNLSRR